MAAQRLRLPFRQGGAGGGAALGSADGSGGMGGSGQHSFGAVPMDVAPEFAGTAGGMPRTNPSEEENYSRHR